MAFLKRVKKHWFSSVIYLAFSLFFLGACFFSANTYSAVVQAQRDITLENPVLDAEELVNGSLRLTFSIEVSNPTRFALHLYTSSWTVRIVNSSSQTEGTITLGTMYMGPTSFLNVSGHEAYTFEFESIVYEPSTLSNIKGFINYSASEGDDYTLETIPYENEFRFIGMIGEFQHEYLRESYLSDLVTIDLRYTSSEGTQ